MSSLSKGCSRSRSEPLEEDSSTALLLSPPLPSHQLQMTFSAFPMHWHAFASDGRLKQECQGGLVISPCWLRPMMHRMMHYGIYQVDQDNKNSKEAPRKTPFFFFFSPLYTLQALNYYAHQSFVTLIEWTFTEEQHGLTHGLPVVVHNLAWTVVLAALESFKELLEELMEDCCFSQLNNMSPSFVMSTTEDAGSFSCIVWQSYALAFWHDITYSISSECQWYHISHS